MRKLLRLNFKSKLKSLNKFLDMNYFSDALSSKRKSYRSGLIVFSISTFTFITILPEFHCENNHYFAVFALIDFDIIKEWFIGLGAKYNVNPWLFGGIYVGAIPFFTISVGRLVRNYKKGKSIILPALVSGFFFISAYLYLMIAGENVPWWVYGFVMLMVVYGAYSTINKIKKQVGAN